MKLINRSNSVIVLANDGKNTIRLNPGEVSVSIIAISRTVYQFITQGSESELAIISECTLDDNILAKIPTASKYVYNDVHEALSKLNPVGSSTNQIQGVNYNDVDGYLKQIENLKDEVALKDNTINTLNANLTKANEMITDSQREIDNLTSSSTGTKDQYEIELNRYKDINTKLATDLQAQSIAYSGEVAKTIELNAEIESLKEKLKASSELESRIEDLTKDLINTKEYFKSVCQDFNLVYDPATSTWSQTPPTVVED